MAYTLHTVGLLTVNPEERLGVDEVMEHPWLQKGTTPDTPLMTPSILEGSMENIVGKGRHLISSDIVLVCSHPFPGLFRPDAESHDGRIYACQQAGVFAAGRL